MNGNPIIRMLVHCIGRVSKDFEPVTKIYTLGKINHLRIPIAF